MQFHELLNILRSFICVDCQSIPDFIARFFYLIMQPPKNKSDNDEYYPYTQPSEIASANKLFSGERTIKKKYTKIIYSSFNDKKLVAEINKLNQSVKAQLCTKLNEFNIDCDTKTVSKVISDLIKKFLEQAINNPNNKTIQVDGMRDYNGHKLPSLPTSTVYIDKNYLFIDKKSIKLPEPLIPPKDYADKTLPYLQALIEIYKEIKAFKKRPTEVKNLDDKYKKHLDSQRKAYYSAKSIQHSLSSVYWDIDDEFDILLKDTYEGINVTYYKENYKNGYERLQTVLEKITSTQLEKSKLKNIDGLIGNLEKKGLCHILVDENLIKSWVNTNE